MSEEIVQITPEPHSVVWWACRGCGALECTLTCGGTEPCPPWEPWEHCTFSSGWDKLNNDDERVQRILIRHKMIAEKLFGSTSSPPEGSKAQP